MSLHSTIKSMECSRKGEVHKSFFGKLELNFSTHKNIIRALIV